MQKGTQQQNSEELSYLFEQHGASIFAEAGEEHAMIGIKMLSRFKEKLLRLFWEMVISPRMDTVEFVRLQKEMITALKAETVDPGSIANRHFYYELAGGAGHPAGRHHTIPSIKRVSIAMVREYHAAYVRPDEAVLVLAGKFSADWFANWCLPFISTWTNDSKKAAFCDAPPVEHREFTIRSIEKNDLTQVSMIIGQAAPGELHPDRNAIALANYVFGAGNFSSRLMNRIRSSSGRTYSIVSHITAERNFGAISIATSTQNSQLQVVVSAILDEYSKFCKDGITLKELENVKKFAIGNMAFQLEGLTNYVEKILWLSFYNRSIDYIETFDTMIEAITLENVNDAIRRSFDPEKLIIAAVGNKKVMNPQLSGFGPLKQYHFKDAL